VTPSLTLVTGGARSGKSRFAEQLAANGRPPILYVATARAEDEEMRSRVEEHRRRRPAAWRTLEQPRGVGRALARYPRGIGTVLLEDMALLISHLLFAVTDGGVPDSATPERLDEIVRGEIGALVAAQTVGGWDLVIVTNEVGWGIVPATPLGRVFRDGLGRANQSLAARADTVFLLVAGVPLRIKPGS
jgi:adenosylcobinamide kinase/adenosylcobinamide-phosphate guanylyltransferase